MAKTPPPERKPTKETIEKAKESRTRAEHKKNNYQLQEDDLKQKLLTGTPPVKQAIVHNGTVVGFLLPNGNVSGAGDVECATNPATIQNDTVTNAGLEDGGGANGLTIGDKVIIVDNAVVRTNTNITGIPKPVPPDPITADGVDPTVGARNRADNADLNQGDIDAYNQLVTEYKEKLARYHLFQQYVEAKKRREHFEQKFKELDTLINDPKSIALERSEQAYSAEEKFEKGEYPAKNELPERPSNDGAYDNYNNARNAYGTALNNYETTKTQLEELENDWKNCKPPVRSEYWFSSQFPSRYKADDKKQFENFKQYVDTTINRGVGTLDQKLDALKTLMRDKLGHATCQNFLEGNNDAWPNAYTIGGAKPGGGGNFVNDDEIREQKMKDLYALWDQYQSALIADKKRTLNTQKKLLDDAKDTLRTEMKPIFDVTSLASKEKLQKISKTQVIIEFNNCSAPQALVNNPELSAIDCSFKPTARAKGIVSKGDVCTASTTPGQTTTLFSVKTALSPTTGEPTTSFTSLYPPISTTRPPGTDFRNPTLQKSLEISLKETWGLKQDSDTIAYFKTSGDLDNPLNDPTVQAARNAGIPDEKISVLVRTQKAGYIYGKEIIERMTLDNFCKLNPGISATTGGTTLVLKKGMGGGGP